VSRPWQILTSAICFAGGIFIYKKCRSFLLHSDWCVHITANSPMFSPCFLTPFSWKNLSVARISTDKRDSTYSCLGARSQAGKRTITFVASQQLRFRSFPFFLLIGRWIHAKVQKKSHICKKKAQYSLKKLDS
jgi:hypothetical protein